jgi:replicative DNA helicase
MAEEPRSLPKNREAEQVVLGCAIVEAETVMPLLTEKLKPAHFYFRAHRAIFQTLLELYDQGQPIDLITLGNRLEEKSLLAEVGGRVYLSELLSTVTTTTSAAYYADIVVKKALLRELAQVGQEIAELGYREDQELDRLLDIAEEKVFQISRQTLKEGYQAVGEILHEHLDVLEKLQDSQRSTVTGLSTGFRELDKRTAGFHPADLIVVAGRPSMGKSSFVLSIARNVALHENKSVGVFSLEMTKEQLIERLLCAEAGINLLRLRSGYLGADSDVWRKLMMAANHLQKAKILIDDTPAISVMELKTKARRMKAEHHGLDLLIVDYLQLVEGGAKVDLREQEISYIARSLKGLARELQIPVIACSQLSRAVERRDSKRPRLSDLRECVTGDTQVIDGQTGNLLDVSQVQPGMSVMALGPEPRLQPARVLDVIPKGTNRVYRLRTQTGREIRATAAHPFLTDQGWRPLQDLTPGTLIATTRSLSLVGLSHAALGYRAVGKRIPRTRAQEVAQRLADPQLQSWAESDVLWERVVSIVPEGEEPVWDLVVEGVHNFVANGIVVHNSGEIEQTADVVLFLYRKDYYDEEPKADEHETSPGEEKSKMAVETEIIIGKQRNGPTDAFTLMFHKVYASFHDLHPFEAVGEGRPPF